MKYIEMSPIPPIRSDNACVSLRPMLLAMCGNINAKIADTPL